MSWSWKKTVSKNIVCLSDKKDHKNKLFKRLMSIASTHLCLSLMYKMIWNLQSTMSLSVYAKPMQPVQFQEYIFSELCIVMSNESSLILKALQYAGYLECVDIYMWKFLPISHISHVSTATIVTVNESLCISENEFVFVRHWAGEVDHCLYSFWK